MPPAPEELSFGPGSAEDRAGREHGWCFSSPASYNEDDCEGTDSVAEVKAIPGAKDMCVVMQEVLPHLRQRQFCPDGGLCEPAPEQLCLGCPGSRRGMLQAETLLKI